MSRRAVIVSVLWLLAACDATTTTAQANESSEASAFPPDAGGNWERIALYVGINDYDHEKIPDLSGCVNDALRMRKALRAHGFVRDAILTNEQATRAKIGEYARLLLKQVDTAVAQGVKEPLVVIYYAGHGNKVKQGDLPDKEKSPGDNTFTTHDTDPDGSRDIRDDDIYRLITRLQEKNATVVFFADACHSSSSFRAAPSMPIRGLDRGGFTFLKRRGPTDSIFDWNPDEKADLRRAYYAACDDADVAGETEVNGIACGKFTQVLVELLESGRPIESYEDLGYAIQQQFALTFPGSRQRPAFHITNQMKGRRFLLQGHALRHARVEKQTGSTKVIITAGSIHGAAEGSRVEFYKDLTDLREMGAAAALVTGKVISADPGSAVVRLDKAVQLPKGAVARVHQPSVPSFRIHLAEGIPDELRQSIEKLASKGQVALAKDGEPFAYEMVYDAKRRCLSLHAPDQLPTAEQPTDPFVRIFPEDPEVNLGDVLLRLGQQHRLLELRSNEDLLAVDLVGSDGKTAPMVNPNTGLVGFEPGGSGKLRIRNLSPKTTFYLGVVLFERERAATGVAPGDGQRRMFGALVDGAEDGLAPGETYVVDLPDIESEWHPNPSRIYLKVVATDQPYDFKRLEDIVVAPYTGTGDANRGDGEQDDVMNFLEDVSRGKRGITPKRTWATGTVVFDAGE